MAKIKVQLNVGLTDEMAEALSTATEFTGSNPSLYARQAIMARLMQEGFVQHPMHRTAAKQTA